MPQPEDFFMVETQRSLHRDMRGNSLDVDVSTSWCSSVWRWGVSRVSLQWMCSITRMILITRHMRRSTGTARRIIPRLPARQCFSVITRADLCLQIRFWFTSFAYNPSPQNVDPPLCTLHDVPLRKRSLRRDSRLNNIDRTRMFDFVWTSSVFKIPCWIEQYFPPVYTRRRSRLRRIPRDNQRRWRLDASPLCCSTPGV